MSCVTNTEPILSACMKCSLGPVEASKPWDTKGIEGVHRFLRNLALFNDEVKGQEFGEDG